MGIKGLHVLLKSIQKPCHLKDYSGQTLGVDAYGWLHRGTVACSVDLVLDRPTRKHIDFVLNRVRMLIYFGVTPYLVFDGDNLPSKAETEAKRQKRRHDSKSLGMELLRKGRTKEAYQELQKAVDVTPLMARELIEELKQMNVQYVVAPYEADAQLVYLEQQGIINGIISEDSDLLVFGAKRLLSKLDQHGDCIEIDRADFGACRDVSLIGWSDDEFRRMCILAGCDYLANIPRMGLKTAHQSIRKYKTVEKAVRMLQFDGQYHVPNDYLKNFKEAELTFLYQRVYCPKAEKLVTLTIPERDVNIEDLTYIGGDVEPEVAVGVARGDLDPATKNPLVLRPPVAANFTEKRLTHTLQRRQTLGSAAELKPNKAINSFFTPKRIPLAELDPNSLTPSPSQQRLLERHVNTSWESVPVSTHPVLTRSASSAASNRYSSPLVRSVDRDSFVTHPSKVSALQSSKRQRLCSDADDRHLPDAPTCRSRFFTNGTDESSPSGLKIDRNKKPRKHSLDVFSDDSIEDMMSQIPDPAETPAKGTSDKDHEVEQNQSSDEANVLAQSAKTESDHDLSKDMREKQEKECNGSSKTVSLESNPAEFQQVLDYHIEKQNSTLLSRFAFQRKNSSARLENFGHAETNIQPNHTVCFSESQIALKAGSPRTPPRRGRSTPLQRLGQSALARSRSLNHLSSSLAAFRASKVLLPPAKPAPAEACKSNLSSTQSLVPTCHGSEDMIIPDSEEEGGEEDSEQPDFEAIRGLQAPFAIDLKRFSFTGGQ
ncbi:putative exonuclease [Aspergillus saccharolyticus JOP 1030-1]|uniref:Uncharacterized protein n=1 Tax=Aspergillus saccharolyticus JOP 1030-1 TaxID=1450539 RepID=A0A318Z053_9EURO|nr:hypothetical protein BP01DRAFT_351668 [Aspergillus saccharolyticus JOP 1030-1]PYH40269.1 hypothetical protein BP01DRAFT_351668 [Aspergillus saccharolyticus JOP 1030-1]